MFFKNIIFITFTLLSLLSCTIHHSYITGSHCNSKCTYLRTGVGRTSAITFLGINGGRSENLLFNAKKNLFRAFPLRKAEFYDNFIVETKITYYPLFKKTTITLWADIVTDDLTSEPEAFTSTYLENLGIIENKWGIYISDSVVFVKKNKLQRGIVVDLNTHNATVLILDKGKEKFIHQPIKNLFTIENELLEEECNCEAGQVLEISLSKGNEPKVEKIVGIQKNKILISVLQNNKVKYYEREYSLPPYQ